MNFGKELSYSAIGGWALGGYISRYVRGAWYWDIYTWAVVLGFTAFIYAVWKYDNRNEVE